LDTRYSSDERKRQTCKKIDNIGSPMTGTPKSAPNGELSQVGTTDTDPSLGRLAGLASLVSDLFAGSGAAQFGLSLELFTRILEEAAAKYLQPDAGTATAREFLSTLHVRELVLARACAAGNDAAWEAFLLRYREPLYEAGISIANDYGVGRELADSLYADLYGAGSSHGVSPLLSYMGYGSLEGWLRTIMARSFIDRYRSERRFVSLEEESDEGFQFAAPPPEPVASVDPRLEQATDEALDSIDPEDRFLLASFFLHGRTLAELAQILRLHESTVSRRIHKITVNLRKHILRGLMRRGMSRRQADEALQTDVRDLQTNVSARLQENLQKTPGQPSYQQEPSTPKAEDDQ
jgi:RNA polymerase sigma-70 factor (ECF subfamily)